LGDFNHLIETTCVPTAIDVVGEIGHSSFQSFEGGLQSSIICNESEVTVSEVTDIIPQCYNGIGG
jgi:hypothetical protein